MKYASMKKLFSAIPSLVTIVYYNNIFKKTALYQVVIELFFV